jgi:hypothetical protein
MIVQCDKCGRTINETTDTAFDSSNQTGNFGRYCYACHAETLGRKGGKAKTQAQDEARAANLAKAREKRWPKKR